VGDSPYFVLEACEYKNNFLRWFPYVGVILNVDIDHNDFYGGIDGVIDSFAQYARNVRLGGALVIHAATQGFERIIQGLPCRVVSYGPGRDGQDDNVSYHFYADGISFSAGGQPSFDVLKNGERLARVDLPLVGVHNIDNALACFCVAEVLGIAPEITKRALENAKGVKRRYEYKGEYNGIPIIDDYAHHPTEIRACLAATKKRHKGRIVCVFQPHLYSRTRDLLEDFANSFAEADKILLVPIFAARESFDPNISSGDLCERIRANGKSVECFNDFSTTEQWLRDNLAQGDLLLTVGAGNVHIIGERLL
jgi:UDP-N-acetylmuramate--alanine ligase